jgi:hypothetical protein
VRLALEVLDRGDDTSPNLARAREMLSALLLTTGERAAEHERQHRVADGATTA